jgi:hypothetical protein
MSIGLSDNGYAVPLISFYSKPLSCANFSAQDFFYYKKLILFQKKLEITIDYTGSVKKFAFQNNKIIRYL